MFLLKNKKLPKYLRLIREGVISLLDALLFNAGLLSGLVIIFDVGFTHTDYTGLLLNRYYFFILHLFLVCSALRLLLKLTRPLGAAPFFADFIMLVIAGTVAGTHHLLPGWQYLNADLLSVLQHKFILYIALLLIFFSELSKRSLKFHQLNIRPARLFVLGFVFMILAGAGLLLLPRSTVSGISFTDALFTSASAFCVTGLTVVDTATHFTSLGKLIILLLIQAGGLGIMTFTSFFGFFFIGQSSYRDQLYLKDFLNTEKMGEVFGLLFKIIFLTLLVEALGAIAIFYQLPAGVFSSMSDKIQFSVFHSISAFCNAGFSTFSDGLYHIQFRYDYSLHLIIALLIILGGIGFPVLFSYYHYLSHYTRMFFRMIFMNKKAQYAPRLINVNTRLVVRTTLILIVAGALAIYLFESQHAFSAMDEAGKITASFFSSVTARTAGFNTIDFSRFSSPVILLIILLMWIGASPGSTGGGIKTTTFALAVLNVISLAKEKDRVEIFRREISALSLRRAHAFLFLSFLAIGTGLFLLSVFDPEKNLIALFFETVSAFSTTGLSLGVTPQLSGPGKIVVIFLMFTGRIGLLIMVTAFIRKARTLQYRYPPENILIN